MSCPIMTPLIREWAKEFGLSEQQALIDYGLAQARVGNLEVTKEQFKAEVERQKQLKQTNQQMTQQAQAKEPLLVSRQYLRYNDKFNSPLAKFHRTFNSFERANAVEAITYDFIKLIDRLNPEAKDKERQSWVVANISLLKSELKKSLEDYLNNSRMQDNEKKRFGEDFVTNKINCINRILGIELDENGVLRQDPYSSNLNFLLKDAAITIEKTEGVIIDFDTKEAKSTEEAEAEEKATEDNEDTGKDGYMIIARETDPKTTLGTRVRKVLANTPKGNERNVFGKPKMLNPDYVHAVLMDKLSNMAYVEDFIQTGNGNIALVALDRLSGKYPWVKTLINKLQSDPMLMSQFFTDFRKDFILYTTTVDVAEEELDDAGNPILDKNGNPVMKIKRVTKYLNQAVALDSTITELINNFENNEKLDKNSIYSDGKVVEDNRKLNAEKLANLSSKIKNRYEFNWNDEANRTEAFNTIKELLNAIGFNTTLNDLDGIYGEASFSEDINTILTNLGTILENSIPENVHLIDYFNGAYTNIAEIIGKVSEIMNVSSARAGDKTFQSYSSTNYINTVLKRLTDKNEERRNKYIQEQFKKFPWFYDKANGKWRNHWVELLESDPNVRAHLQIDNMATITITDEDGNPKVVKYSDWTEDMMKKDFFLQYHGFPNQSKRETQFGRFHMPIYSDSPVVNFITMPKFTGDFRTQILDKLCDVVEQELLRIRDVAERARLAKRQELLGIEKIASYDKTGDRFLFFPKLNDIEGFYNTVNDLLLNNKVDEARAIIKNALRDIMEEGAREYRDSNPISAKEAIDNGIINSESELDEALDEYYWNQAYATTQIIQIATTDLAYYKNGVDFQKRFKEVYASGNKLNTNSTWGKKKERVLYLKDEVLKSNVFGDIEEVLKQAVAEGRISKIDAQAIKNKFKEVNVADAQAYRSIYSMRAVLDMMGQWTDEMQKAVEKFNSGSWTTQDFTTIWQTIKPFMFTQIEDNTPGFFEARKVPHQHKNSEFLLLAMHSLIANSNIGKSEVLKSLNEWMVENDVDVVMFESAVKAGGQGVTPISSSMTGTQVTDRLNEYRDASSVTIKEFDYEDYVVQQPTPEHLIDHLGIFGSQFRNLIVSDLTDGTTFKVNGKEYTKAEILKLYQGAIVENLLEDYERVKGRFATIEDLHNALLDSIKGNPKYGSDIVEALEIVGAVNGKGGRFNIPLYNPSTTEKLQEVINSFFKNAITKQKIKGGNAILVSDFGFVDDLHCVYGTTKEGKKYLKEVECYLPAYSKDFYQAFMKKDAKGNEYLDVSLMPDELKYAIGYRIPTEGKYSMVPLKIKGFLPQANGSAIMLPADITVHAGSDYDVDKLFLMLPEFRTVTDWKGLENKILENEGFKKWGRDNVRITLDMIKNGKIAFSENTPEMHIYDYYSQHKREFTKVSKVNYNHSKPIQDNSKAQRNNLLIDISRSILTNPDTVDKFVSPGSFDKLKRTARISEIADNIDLVESWKKKMQEELPTLCNKLEQEIARTSDKDKLEELKDSLKKAEAKLARVNKLTLETEDTINALLSHDRLTDDDLKEIATGTERDPLSPLTFYYYHKQNMTGGALIGMYANNTTLFAKFQSYDQSKSRMKLKFEVVLNGHRYSRLDGIYSTNGDIISKNCAEFSAASVDNVKDPVLAKLMQSTDTANITALMLRMGMSIEEIGLLFTQPIVKEWVKIIPDHLGYKENFSTLLNLYVDEIEDTFSESNPVKELISRYFVGQVDTLPNYLTSKDLISYKMFDKVYDEIKDNSDYYILGNTSYDFKTSQISILLLMDKLYQASKQLKRITKVSRADSPNGAMAITIAGNIIQKQAVSALRTAMKQDDWMIEGADIYDENINDSLTKDQLRSAIMNSRFPMLQAFYSLGIDFGENLMKPYFIQYNDEVMSIVNELTTQSKGDTLDERQLNNFFKDLIKYELSDLEMFTSKGSFNETRDFYLSTYPYRFMKLKQSHPEIAKLGIMKHIKQDDNGHLSFENSGRITQSMRDSFMRDLDSLLYGDEIAQQMAIDLFAYSYFKDGFYFGPNSFGNFFSTNFINHIEGFTDKLNAMNGIHSSRMSEFLEQFLVNNLRSGILMNMPFGKDEVTGESKVRYYPHNDSNTGNYQIIMNTKYIINKKNGQPRKYFVYTQNDEATGRKYKFLAIMTNAGTDTTTYRLIPASDTRMNVKQSDGSVKKVFTSSRYGKGMSAYDLGNYRTVDETVAGYIISSEENPEYITEVDLDEEYRETPKKLEKIYSKETNENDTNLCK